jgi:hypothetical protein
MKEYVGLEVSLFIREVLSPNLGQILKFFAISSVLPDKHQDSTTVLATTLPIETVPIQQSSYPPTLYGLDNESVVMQLTKERKTIYNLSTVLPPLSKWICEDDRNDFTCKE